MNEGTLEAALASFRAFILRHAGGLLAPNPLPMAAVGSSHRDVLKHTAQMLTGNLAVMSYATTQQGIYLHKAIEGFESNLRVQRAERDLVRQGRIPF